MEKYYHFAGVDLMISIPSDRMYEDDRCLAPFRVTKFQDLEQSELPSAHYFRFTVTEKLIKPEGEPVVIYPDYRVYSKGNVRYIGTVLNDWKPAYIRAEHHGKKHEVQLKAESLGTKIGVNTVLTSIGAEHLVAEEGGFILHASYVEWQGKAILFTAPSETGKSTQADLWHELRGAEIINGDRAVVRVVNGEALASGLPFSGSSKHCKNRTLPLAAIVYLQQAETTSIESFAGAGAFCKIWEGISLNTWNTEDVEKISGILQQVLGQVPVYRLACTPDESAVNVLEQMIESK